KSLAEANSLLGSGSLPDTSAYFGGPGFTPFGFGGFGRFGLFGGGFFGDPCQGFWMFSPLYGSYVYLPNYGGPCLPSLFSPYGFEYLSTAFIPTTTAGGGTRSGRTGPFPTGGGFTHHKPVLPGNGVLSTTGKTQSNPKVFIFNRANPMVSGRGTFGSGTSHS